MTREPLFIYFCTVCKRERFGTKDDATCPVCGNSMVEEAR